MDAAYAHLRRHRVRHASSGPQTLPSWNPNAGGISAFYFKDPDGHVLEVIHFPPGKGDARWHATSDRIFLGIDHTAIVVDDTERSVLFYRDALGMRVAGESENHGVEQERLNNVFGARLRITTLRARSGPGVELLEYLAPSDGRPIPADARANDLVHWHTTIAAPSASRLSELARNGRVRSVSSGVVALPKEFGEFEAGQHLLDPDGHAILVVQRRKPR
jgi:catechol 2,3-dioxygenase-like lactoylglutathione lyase family enzyme